MPKPAVPPWLPPDRLGGPLSARNGGCRPTLADLRHSGRMLRGEFARGADFPLASARWCHPATTPRHRFLDIELSVEKATTGTGASQGTG